MRWWGDSGGAGGEWRVASALPGAAGADGLQANPASGRGAPLVSTPSQQFPTGQYEEAEESKAALDHHHIVAHPVLPRSRPAASTRARGSPGRVPCPPPGATERQRDVLGRELMPPEPRLARSSRFPLHALLLISLVPLVSGPGQQCAPDAGYKRSRAPIRPLLRRATSGSMRYTSFHAACSSPQVGAAWGRGAAAGARDIQRWYK